MSKKHVNKDAITSAHLMFSKSYYIHKSALLNGRSKGTGKVFEATGNFP